MAIDRWFIGGGAEHTPESARRLVYASTGGAEGVGGVNDLKVVPLDVPGQGVKVLIGSALIRSRYLEGDTQTYMGTVYSQEIVETVPTGSGAGRSDLVVLRVEDPFAAGSVFSEPDPGELATAPYVYVRVISGVPGNTKRLQDVAGYQNDTAITLARIDFPASTGTVTAGMITDLREVANPRRSEVVHARPRVLADDGASMYLRGKRKNGGEFFPGGAGVANGFTVFVPEWATRMVIDAHWLGVKCGHGDAYGTYWVEYGDEYKPHTWPYNRQYEYATQEFNFNFPNTNDDKNETWPLMDEVGIPAKYRGKEITFVYKAGRADAGSGPEWNDRVYMNVLGGLGMRITFAESAISPNML